jgi:hypothetical protein
MTPHRTLLYPALAALFFLLALAGFFLASPSVNPPHTPATPSTDAAAPPTLLDAWRDLVKQSAHARQAPASLQFHMEASSRSGPPEKPDMNMKYAMDYKRQDLKFYAFCHVSGEHHVARLQLPPGARLPPDGKEDFGVEIAFDGLLVRDRRVDGNMLTQTRDVEKAVLPHPLPWASLELHTPQDLEELLADGKITLASLQDTHENNSLLRIVSFHYAPSGHLFYRATYDASRGLLPVKAEEFTENGTLYAQTRGITIQELHANNQTFYLPTSGIVETFRDGQTVVYQDFHLDPATILVNQPLPDQTFRLTPRPNEKIFDADSSTLLPADPQPPAP